MLTTRILVIIISMISLACQGDRGPVGPRGVQGVPGVQGGQGIKGAQGAQGDQGPLGADGETLDWSDVITTNNLYEATYVVGVMTDSQNYTVGTGFRAYWNNVIWTNAHVAQGINDLVSNPLLANDNPRAFVTKSGTVIGSSRTYIWTNFWIHPQYDGTLESPDVGLVYIPDLTGVPVELDLPGFLPREMLDDLRIGQPVGTLGFPGWADLHNDVLPLATFKDGTLGALRPFYDDQFFSGPNNTGQVLHYNMVLRGGTSGSPVFDHNGYIVAVHYAGITISVQSGAVVIGEIDTAENYGIHVASIWDFIDWLDTDESFWYVLGGPGENSHLALKKTAPPKQEFLGGIPEDKYMPYPPNWNGQTLAP